MKKILATVAASLALAAPIAFSSSTPAEAATYSGCGTKLGTKFTRTTGGCQVGNTSLRLLCQDGNRYRTITSHVGPGYKSLQCPIMYRPIAVSLNYR